MTRIAQARNTAADTGGMRLRFALPIFIAVAAMALALAGDALAASRPQITFVSPMRVKPGATLTVRGRHFLPRRGANTVIFRAPSGRVAFAKSRSASRRRLVVVVPAGV